MKNLRLALIAIAALALIFATACPDETEEPAAQEPAAEEPAAEEPADEEPAAEEPADEEPAAEEGTDEEATDEEAETAAAPIRLAPDFMPDPRTVEGTAGGPVEADGEETEHGPCLGYLPQEPQHVLELTEDFSYLEVSATSDIDTSLVIEGPEGKLCNDDADDLDPSISGEWPAGTYRIFVGSYDQEEQGSYTLEITELQ